MGVMLADLLLMYWLLYTASQIYGAAHLNIKLLESIRLAVMQRGANGRRLSGEPPRASVTGSEIGTEKSRCLDGVCVKFDISLLSLWLSPSKKISNTGGTPVPPAHAGACWQDGGKG